MKRNCLVGILLITGILAGENPAFGYATESARSNCRIWPKYKARVSLETVCGKPGNTYVCGVCVDDDHGCGFASARCYYSGGLYGCPSPGYRLANAYRDGSRDCAYVVGTCSHIWGGRGYTLPVGSIPLEAFSGAFYDFPSVIEETILTNNLVVISNIGGTIMVENGTFASAALAYVIWRATETNATEEVTPEKVLYWGSAWIEDGVLKTTNGYSPNDFEISYGTYRDTNNLSNPNNVYSVMKVTTIPGLTKIIQVDPSVTNENIVMTIVADAGFGHYNPASILDQSPLQPVLSMPSFQPDGSLEFIFYGASGRDYSVDFSHDLFSWSPLLTVTNPNAPVTIRDSASVSNGNRRFYRSHSP